MMNGWFLAAGIVSLAGMLLHVLVGGRLFVRPLLAYDIPPEHNWLAYFVWHVGTVAPGLLSAGFLAAAFLPHRSDYAVIAATFAGLLALTALWTSVRSRRSPMAIPAFPVFSAVCLLGLGGLVF
ncbi:MAG: hypothetical protein ACQRW7_12250 [Caulobacterales bacterium]|uniref:hypothetical protein n=1 Tax=Glycocaulis sp. TaxID=1969725 RepID=UPI003F9EC333